MSVYVPVELRRQVRSYFRSGCAYCRSAESLSVVTFELEHIVPLSHGGKTEFENLCLACPTCNRHKADRVSGRLESDGDEVAFFHPHRDRWADHFAWSDDFTTLIGLSIIWKVTIDALRINRPQLVRVRRIWVATNEHPPVD